LKKISVIILTLAITCFGSGFLKLSEFEKMRRETKQDSVTVWVENPIPDQELTFLDTVELNISWVFNEFPDNIDWNPVIENSTLIYANIFQNGNNDLILTIKSKNQHGRTDVTYNAYFYEYAYTDSLQTDSIVVDTLMLSDTFKVSVYNPDYQIMEWGTAYSFLPENCVGFGETEWKAASVFDLGATDYELKEIEFGYAWDGVADWRITEFSEVPGDSSILVTDSTFYSTSFKGGEAQYIEIPADSSLKMSGSIAVVFTTTPNFMAMDPLGNSDNTWIYSEASGWDNLGDIPDYSGAWYIRLLVYNTSTGIEEIITTEKKPALLKNYPNPFNNETVISWNLQKSGQVELNIFNSKGQLVKNLVNEAENKGKHSAVFNADGMQTGIYFYQLKINGKIENSAKMLYLK